MTAPLPIHTPAKAAPEYAAQRSGADPSSPDRPQEHIRGERPMQDVHESILEQVRLDTETPTIAVDVTRNFTTDDDGSEIVGIQTTCTYPDGKSFTKPVCALHVSDLPTDADQLLAVATANLIECVDNDAEAFLPEGESRLLKVGARTVLGRKATPMSKEMAALHAAAKAVADNEHSGLSDDDFTVLVDAEVETEFTIQGTIHSECAQAISGFASVDVFRSDSDEDWGIDISSRMTRAQFLELLAGLQAHGFFSAPAIKVKPAPAEPSAS